MYFARPSGSGYPNQLEAIIPYGSTKTYTFSGLLYLQGFSYPADPLDMVSVEYPSLFCPRFLCNLSSLTSAAVLKHITAYYYRWVYQSHEKNQKPNNQLRPGILTDGIKYMVSLSGKAFVRQPPVGPVSRCKYLRYDTAITPYTVILLTTEGSQIFGTYLMLEPKK